MTRQFDVFANPSPRSRERGLYLLVLSFRFFLGRRTTIIAPLVMADLPPPLERLNPRFTVADRDVVLSPMELLNIPTGGLETWVASLAAERDSIIDALDVLFTGIRGTPWPTSSTSTRPARRRPARTRP